MSRIPLAEIVKTLGQNRVAAALDVSAPAIAKAVKAGRLIFVIQNEDGKLKAEEVKTFPNRRLLEADR